MTDPTTTAADEQEHTLPSGLKVTIRSHRVLKRADIQAVWAAGANAKPGMEMAAQRDKLIELLATATGVQSGEPITMSADYLDLLDGADYIALYKLMNNAYRLANGLSVVPNPDDYQDPKAPTAASNGSNPASADTEPTSNATPATTGTTSRTTSTSTAPDSGPRTS